MTGGWSFCGVDIADLGLTYVPSREETYVWQQRYNVQEETLEGRHGGYYYGATVPPKEFQLQCFFENEDIRNGHVDRVMQFFRRGTTGRLVFADRPQLYYIATVVGCELSRITNYENGFVVVSLKAYYPFARTEEFALTEANQKTMGAFANLLPAEQMPPRIIATEDNPLTQQTTILLYNGGTEDAALKVNLAGDVGTGIDMVNKTNGQQMGVAALTNAITGEAGKWLCVDGLNGTVKLTNGETSEDAYLYHDYGYLSIAPSGAPSGDLHYRWEQNEMRQSILHTEEVLLPLYVGKHIYIGGQWNKIAAVKDAHTGILSQPVTSSGEGVGPIVQMNELVLTPKDNMRLTQLSFDYQHTFM